MPQYTRSNGYRNVTAHFPGSYVTIEAQRGFQAKPDLGISPI